LWKFIAFFDLHTVLSLLFAINENYNKMISDIFFVKYVVDVDDDGDDDDVYLNQSIYFKTFKIINYIFPINNGKSPLFFIWKFIS
jgi:hypothetical protein